MVLPWLLCLVLGSYLLGRAQPRHVMTIPTAAPTRDFQMTLLKPESGERIAAKGETTKVRFRWNVRRTDETPIPRGFPAALLLELSTRADFAPEATEMTRLPSLVTTELSDWLKPGHYFWRLRIGTGIYGETREFRVIEPKNEDEEG